MRAIRAGSTSSEEDRNFINRLQIAWNAFCDSTRDDQLIISDPSSDGDFRNASLACLRNASGANCGQKPVSARAGGRAAPRRSGGQPAIIRLRSTSLKLCRELTSLFIRKWVSCPWWTLCINPRDFIALLYRDRLVRQNYSPKVTFERNLMRSLPVYFKDSDAKRSSGGFQGTREILRHYTCACRKIGTIYFSWN